MPGLLDITDDPNTLGLLSLGLRLMSTPGKFGTALGQAGMGALGDLQQARQMTDLRKLREQQAKMQGLQMQSLEQQLADAQRAREEAAALKQTRGSFLDSIDPTAGPAMPPTLVGAMRAGFSPQEAQTFLPPKPEAFTLKQGERRYEGNKVVAEIPAEPPKGTRLAELIRERDALPPGHPLRATYDSAIRKETTHQPATTVSVDQRQPNAFATDQGKSFSELMTNINKAGFESPAMLRKLERMEQLLQGVDGGKLAPTGLEVASAANALGIKLDPKLGNKEAAQALSREIAGGFRQPGTGPMTDKDFENFLLQVPDLSKTAEGRAQITATMRAASYRSMEIAKRAREYVRKNGQLDNNFLDEVAQFVAENPVVAAPKGWKVK